MFELYFKRFNLHRLGGFRISHFVYNTRESWSIKKYLIMHRACRRSHISRVPFAPLGSGAHSAPAWAGWLRGNFIAGSALLVFCSRVRAAAKHSVLTPTFYRKKNKFLKSGFVRLPLQQLKITRSRHAKLLTHNA